MKKILLQRGFTLIELLVVIAIIGILTAIVTANFTTAKSKSRDAKRVSDLAQIQLALEQAFDKCSTYPPTLVETTTVCTINNTPFTLSYFISKVPKEDATNSYYYTVASGGLDYVLRAKLENNNGVLIDDIDTANITDANMRTTVTTAGGCDDTASPFYYCVQPK